MKIALVSCVKTKLAGSDYHKAGDLYISPLFTGKRRYAEKHADRWLILSALHGLLTPDQMVKPYEKMLGSMTHRERAAWAAPIVRALDRLLEPGDEVIMLAGHAYRDYVIGNFDRLGVKLINPMEGMGIGQQLHFLKEANS